MNTIDSPFFFLAPLFTAASPCSSSAPPQFRSAPPPPPSSSRRCARSGTSQRLRGSLCWKMPLKQFQAFLGPKRTVRASYPYILLSSTQRNPSQNREEKRRGLPCLSCRIHSLPALSLLEPLFLSFLSLSRSSFLSPFVSLSLPYSLVLYLDHSLTLFLFEISGNESN